jgi:hypothetical protein
MSNGVKHMDKPKFAYVIDISTTPEKLCNAVIQAVLGR